MIGLDTNLLLRFFLKDDPLQSEKAVLLFASLSQSVPGYISCITLMEFVWFLRRRVRLTREQIIEGISDLLDSKDIVVEDEQIVEEALYITSTAHVEFADVFIALRNRHAGCTKTMTFDVKAAKNIPGMELLA